MRICRDMETGEFLVNPSFDQAEDSDLDLVVAGSKDAVYMLEAGAQEVTEEDMLAALMFAQEAIGAFCDVQERFLAKLEITPQDRRDAQHRRGPESEPHLRRRVPRR